MSRFDDGIRRAAEDRSPAGELVQAGSAVGRRMQRSPWELHGGEVAPVAPAPAVEPYAIARPERQLFELVAEPEPRRRGPRRWLRAAVVAAVIAGAAVFGAGYV